MSKHLLAVLTLGLAVAGSATAQQVSPSQPPAKAAPLELYYGDPAHPNVGGFWRPDPANPAVFSVGGKALPGRDKNNHQRGLPYKAAWRKALDARYAADLAGVPYGDPIQSCWPPGIVGDYMVEPNGVEIMQTPGLITMIFERQSSMRWIHTDGRGHVTGDDAEPTLKGDSIGRWEGDELLVDTVNIRRETTLGFYLPHSGKMRVVERFKRVDPETLQINIQLTDPVAFTRPVGVVLTYKKADDATIIERICREDLWNSGKRVDNDLVVRPDTRVKKVYGFDLPNVH